VPFPPGSPAAFPSSWIKASGFASHSFERFAFSSFIYPQITQLKNIKKINPQISPPARRSLRLGEQINADYLF